MLTKSKLLLLFFLSLSLKISAVGDSVGGMLPNTSLLFRTLMVRSAQ